MRWICSSTVFCCQERKQAILRKTEAKLEQTKQKKISGFYQFNSGLTDERSTSGPGAETKRKALVNTGQMVGDPVAGRMSTARRGSDYGQRRKFAEGHDPGISTCLVEAAFRFTHLPMHYAFEHFVLLCYLSLFFVVVVFLIWLMFVSLIV